MMLKSKQFPQVYPGPTLTQQLKAVPVRHSKQNLVKRGTWLSKHHTYLRLPWLRTHASKLGERKAFVYVRVTAKEDAPSTAPCLAPGLYDIPGLCNPEAFFDICEEVEVACGQLLQQIVVLDVLSQEEPGASALEAELDKLVGAYEFAVSCCGLPAAHCREHHEAHAWRLAASLVEDEQLKPISQALYAVLARHSLWQQMQRRRLGAGSVLNPQSHEQQQQQQQQEQLSKQLGRQGQQQELQQQQNEQQAAQEAVRELERRPWRRHQEQEQQQQQQLQEQQQHAGLYASKEQQQLWQLQQNAVSASTLLTTQGQQDLQELEALEEQLKEVGEQVLSGPGDPCLVLDWRSEVLGDDLLAQLCSPLPDSLDDHEQQQQQQLTDADASVVLGCSFACVLTALEQEKQAMHTTQSTPGALLGVGGVLATELPTGTPLSLGHAAYCSPRAALAAQGWQMRGCRGPPPQLALLPLSPRLSSALVATHPSPAMRHLAYQAGVAPRVQGFWGVIDALRDVRHAISSLQGFPSYAHRAWADTSAAHPGAVAAFLEELAAALHPLAAAEAKALSETPAVDSKGRQQRRRHKDGQRHQKYAINPWDLEYAQEADAAHRSSVHKLDWLVLSPLFPLHHILSDGLSNILEPAGLRIALADGLPICARSSSSTHAGVDSSSNKGSLHSSSTHAGMDIRHSSSKHAWNGSPHSSSPHSSSTRAAKNGSPCRSSSSGNSHASRSAVADTGHDLRRSEWVNTTGSYSSEAWHSNAPFFKLLLFDVQGDSSVVEIGQPGSRAPNQSHTQAHASAPQAHSHMQGHTHREVHACKLLGCIYCICDPQCAMPFTQLIRPGTGIHSSTLSACLPSVAPASTPGSNLPHVALHLPAGSVCTTTNTRPSVPRKQQELNQQPRQQQQQQQQGTHLSSNSKQQQQESMHASSHRKLELHGSNTHLSPQSVQQERNQHTTTLMRSPELLKLILHEIGHAISMILSSHAAPHSVFGNVGFASTDVQELSAHILERCAYDPLCLMALSNPQQNKADDPTHPHETRKSRRLMSQGFSLPDAAQLAYSLRSQTSSRSAVEQHQQVLLAIADLKLHAGDSSRGSSSCLVKGVWDQHGLTTHDSPAYTQQVLHLLPHLLHTPAVMAAYPLSDVLSAAIWRHHNLVNEPSKEAVGGQVAGVPMQSVAGARTTIDSELKGWAAVRGHVLEAGAGSKLDAMVVGLLGSDSMRAIMAQPACLELERGAQCRALAGIIPDLAAHIFQELEI